MEIRTYYGDPILSHSFFHFLADQWGRYFYGEYLAGKRELPSYVGPWSNPWKEKNKKMKKSVDICMEF